MAQVSLRRSLSPMICSGAMKGREPTTVAPISLSLRILAAPKSSSFRVPYSRSQAPAWERTCGPSSAWAGKMPDSQEKLEAGGTGFQPVRTQV